MDRLADTPGAPYYAVIFSNQRTNDNMELYEEVAQAMVTLATSQPGSLGVESTRDAEGFGITVSYWKDRASIDAWREHVDHLAAQRLGRERFYRIFSVRIARVEADRTWGA